MFLNYKLSGFLINLSILSIILLYVYSIKNHIFVSAYIFWIMIILLFFSIFFQILWTNLPNDSPCIILLETMLINATFHLFYVLPYYGIRGSDAYFDMESLKSILFSGHILGDSRYFSVTGYWPLLHIFGAFFSLFAKIPAFEVCKWLMPLISIALPPILYIFFMNIINDKKICLISILFFISLQQYILFGSLFVRESIAYIYLVCSLYFLFNQRTGNDPRFKSLTLLFILLLTAAHHFTSLVFAVFLLIYYLTDKLIFVHSQSSFPRKPISETMLALAFAVILAYWIYIYIQPLVTIGAFLTGILAPLSTTTYAQAVGISPSTFSIRTKIISALFVIFYLSFAMYLLVQFFKCLRIHRADIISLILFLYIFGGVALIFLFILPITSIGINPDRLLTFGWLFGSLPLALSVLKHKHRVFHSIGIFLLFGFMIYDIYLVEPSIWDPTSNYIPMATSNEDYSLAKSMTIPDNYKLYAYQNALMAIYDVQNRDGNIISPEKSFLIQSDTFYIFNTKIFRTDKFNKNFTALKAFDSNNLDMYIT